MRRVQVTQLITLTDCICLAPCKERCKVCGVVLCKMTKKFKNDCTECAEWFLDFLEENKLRAMCEIHDIILRNPRVIGW